MFRLKRKQSFVTPFSQTSFAISPHPRVHAAQQLTQRKEDSNALSPVHLGRHVQTITPHTRQKIKQRFAYGFSNVSTKDTSPGIYVPFDLSQISCISRESVDTEEKTYQEENGELDEVIMADIISAGQNPSYRERESDVEILQDTDVRIIGDTNAADESVNDEKESNVIVKLVTTAEQGNLALQNNNDKNESVPGPQLAQEQNTIEASGIDKQIVNGRKGKTDKNSVLITNTSLRKNKSRGQKGKRVSRIETTSPRTIKDLKTRKTTGKLPTRRGGRCDGKRKKGDDLCSLSISCESRNDKTRRRKCKRSFQVMKQEVLKTLNKMHLEIHELLERRKKLCTNADMPKSTDEGSTPNLQDDSKQTKGELVQEE